MWPVHCARIKKLIEKMVPAISSENHLNFIVLEKCKIKCVEGKEGKEGKAKKIFYDDKGWLNLDK